MAKSGSFDKYVNKEKNCPQQAYAISIITDIISKCYW